MIKLSLAVLAILAIAVPLSAHAFPGNPCLIVENANTQLGALNHKFQTISDNPANTKPAPLASINIKINQVSKMLEAVDPENADDKGELQKDLLELQTTALNTEAIALAFPAQKGTPAGDQIDNIMTSVGNLKSLIEILIGL